MEADSILALAKIRQAELQAEVAHYRSGRQEAVPIPTLSELLMTGVERVVRIWATLSAGRRRASSIDTAERRAGVTLASVGPR
jgi:hypothetical protein